VGRDALLAIKERGPARKLAGFEIVGRGIARAGYAIQSTTGEPIGHVTSGMPSPTLNKPLGLGLVAVEYSTPGSEFDILIRGKPVRARAVKTPFYKPRYKKPQRENS
jgi:aminomethyltransferase